MANKKDGVSLGGLATLSPEVAKALAEHFQKGPRETSGPVTLFPRATQPVEAGPRFALSGVASSSENPFQPQAGIEKLAPMEKLSGRRPAGDRQAGAAPGGPAGH